MNHKHERHQNKTWMKILLQKDSWVMVTEVDGEPDGSVSVFVFCDDLLVIGRAGSMEKGHRSHMTVG